MPHDITLITTVAAGLGLALVLGGLAMRVCVPPLVGYLVAGIIAGQHGSIFMGEHELAGAMTNHVLSRMAPRQ